MIKKDKKQEESGGLPDTYGGIVTLLLCFFILIYSISYVDQNKWKMLVGDLNPAAVESSSADVQSLSGEEEESASYAVSENGDITDFNQLYPALKQVIEARNMQEGVESVSGNGFTFLSFRNSVFFDGEGSVLRQEGKEFLDQIAGTLTRADRTIKEVKVLSHTSQKDPGTPNNIRNDRMLSAQRSAELVIYLQSRNAVSPEKLVSLSFGQYRPIAPVDSEDGKEKNGRLEVLITQSDTAESSLEEYYNQIYHQSQLETDN